MNTRIGAKDAKLKVISAGSAAELETSVQTWLDGRTSETLLGIEYKTAGETYHSVILLYTI